MVEYDTNVSTRFMYDGVQAAVEIDNPAGNILKRYVWGDGADELLVEYAGSGTANRRWLHADERGSIVASSDGSGAMLAINRYDEFGKPQATNSGRFQYTGQMWLGEAGLYYYKNRFYAAHLGRFVQTDPTGYDAGPNLYAYVLADPISFVDPLGLEEQCGVVTGSRIQTCGVSYQFALFSVGVAAFSSPTEAREADRTGGVSLLDPTLAALHPASILLGDHDYTAGPNLICPTAWGCSAQMVGHVYSQVGNQIPGNEGDPRAIVSGGTYYVALGPIGLGQVQSYVGKGGLTVNNITKIDHLAYDGWVNRNAVLTPDGWYSLTHGSGTNYYLGVFNALVHKLAGPIPFNALDRSIRSQLYQITHGSRSVR